MSIKPSPIEGRYEWTDDTIPLSNRLVFRQGETVRISVLDKKALASWSHYFKGADDFSTIRRCRKLDGLDCPDCNKGSTPQPRFGCVVIVYTLSEDGASFDWEAWPWLFGKDKFKRLREISKQAGDLNKLDLIITCHNEKFQNVKIRYERDSYLRQVKVEDVVPAYKEQTAELKRIMDIGGLMSAEETARPSPSGGSTSRAPSSAPPRGSTSAPPSRAASPPAQPSGKTPPPRGPAPKAAPAPSASSDMRTHCEDQATQPVSETPPVGPGGDDAAISAAIDEIFNES